MDNKNVIVICENRFVVKLMKELLEEYQKNVRADFIPILSFDERDELYFSNIRGKTYDKILNTCVEENEEKVLETVKEVLKLSHVKNDELQSLNIDMEDSKSIINSFAEYFY